MGKKPVVGAYLRVSVDDDPDHPSTSPERQLEDIRWYADSKGWELAPEPYEDRDLSAWRENVERPAYERMLEDLKAGKIDGVVIWKLDRLVRRITEFSRFWGVCEPAGGLLAAVHDPIDTSTPIGLAVVYLLVAVAESESRNTSLRTRRAEQEKAAKGKPKITSVRPYGMSIDWSEIIEEEADVIREAAAQVLAGTSLKSICRDLNERGVPTSNGGKGWRPYSLKYLLTAPRLWGMRTYKGKIVGPGNWSAILTPEMGERLLALFAGRSIGARGAPRRALLSGVLRCGECKKKMVAGKANGGVPRYMCPSPPEGCGKAVIKSAELEEFLVEAALSTLEDPKVQQRLRQRDDVVAGGAIQELSNLRARMTDLAELWSSGEITRAEWMAARQPLQGRIEAVENQLARATQTDPLIDFLGTDVRAKWEALKDQPERQRAVLAALLVRVEIARSERRGKPFSPSRISDVEWAA